MKPGILFVESGLPFDHNLVLIFSSGVSSKNHPQAGWFNQSQHNRLSSFPPLSYAQTGFPLIQNSAPHALHLIPSLSSTSSSVKPLPASQTHKYCYKAYARHSSSHLKISANSSSWQPNAAGTIYPHFMNEQCKIQRCWVTCPRSHSKKVFRMSLAFN